MHNFDLKNRTAIITGGAQGFGLDIAKRFIKSGANVIIWDIDQKELEKASKEIDSSSLSYNVVDVSDFNRVNEIVNRIIKKSKIDILINNAGITGSTDSLWNYGRIVNVASVAGKDGNANASAYSSAKAGAIALTKSLGKELSDKNIAVNAVTPAGAKTRILDQMSKEHVARMLSKVPRGRFLELGEFTSLICWLSSEENSFSTAAVFDISGGRSTY